MLKHLEKVNLAIYLRQYFRVKKLIKAEYLQKNFFKSVYPIIYSQNDMVQCSTRMCIIKNLEKVNLSYTSDNILV
jgi:hypothetical protein